MTTKIDQPIKGFKVVEPEVEGKVAPSLPIEPRPEVLRGATYKLKLDHLPNPYYVIINQREVEGKLVPYELFINSLDPNHLSWSSVASRLISAIFRNGGNVGFVAKELKEMFESAPFWYKGSQYNSMAHLIGVTIENHCERIGYVG